MTNIIDKHIRYNILKSDYKILEKILLMHSKNKLTAEDFLEKLHKLKDKFMQTMPRIIQLTEKIEKALPLTTNYLITEHLYTINSPFALTFSLAHDVKIDNTFFMYVQDVINSIRNKDFEKVLLFCKDNKVNLKGRSILLSNKPICASNLENFVKTHMFIDLCYQNKKKEAAMFCKNNFVPEMRKYLILIVCKSIEIDYEDDIADINVIIEFFSEVAYTLHGLSLKTRLTRRIAYGIVAYKTSKCGQNLKCPACLKILATIVSKLPSSKRDISVILCSDCGKETDGNNLPYLYETGHIYCEDYISKSDYIYECKITGKICKEMPLICYFV